MSNHTLAQIRTLYSALLPYERERVRAELLGFDATPSNPAVVSWMAYSKRVGTVFPGEREAEEHAAQLRRTEGITSVRCYSFDMLDLSPMVGVVPPKGEMATTTGEEADVEEPGQFGSSSPEGIVVTAPVPDDAASNSVDPVDLPLSPKSSVAVLVLRSDGHVLLVESAKSGRGWEMPGGMVEEGETPLEAARREVLEETGLRLQTIRLLCSAPPGGTWLFEATAEGLPLPGTSERSAAWASAVGVRGLETSNRLSDISSRPLLVRWAVSQGSDQDIVEAERVGTEKQRTEATEMPKLVRAAFWRGVEMGRTEALQHPGVLVVLVLEEKLTEDERRRVIAAAGMLRGVVKASAVRSG